MRRPGRRTDVCRHDSSGSRPFYTAAPVRKSLTTFPDLRRMLSSLTATPEVADIRGWQLSHGPFVGRPEGRNAHNSPHHPRFLGHRLFVAALPFGGRRQSLNVTSCERKGNELHVTVQQPCGPQPCGPQAACLPGSSCGNIIPGTTSRVLSGPSCRALTMDWAHIPIPIVKVQRLPVCQ